MKPRRVSPLPFVGTGAQNEQALVDWILAVTLLLTCCVTLAKSPASSELLGVLIYLHWTNNSHYEPHMGGKQNSNNRDPGKEGFLQLLGR